MKQHSWPKLLGIKFRRRAPKNHNNNFLYDHVNKICQFLLTFELSYPVPKVVNTHCQVFSVLPWLSTLWGLRTIVIFIVCLVTGKTCEEFVSTCRDSQCGGDESRGKCVTDRNGEPRCECLHGYWGENCQYSQCDKLNLCSKGG